MKEIIDKLISRLEEQKTRYREIRKNTYCRRTEMDDCDSCRADHYLDARLEGINKAKEIVNELAEEYYANSPQKSADGWIPCSERLPKQNEEVIASLLVNGKPLVMEITYDHTWLDDDLSKLIAWQPLPAHYTEGE